MARTLAKVLVSLALAAQAADSQAGLPAPPVFKWQRCPPAYCETGWYASPAAADVDGDGQVDALWGGYTLMAVNGSTGALEWQYAPPGGNRIWPDVAVADVDGDRHLEVVVSFGSGSRCCTGTGAHSPRGRRSPLPAGRSAPSASPTSRATASRRS